MLTADQQALFIYLVAHMLDDKVHDILEEYQGLTEDQIYSGNLALSNLQEQGYSIYDLNQLQVELGLNSLL